MPARAVSLPRTLWHSPLHVNSAAAPPMREVSLIVSTCQILHRTGPGMEERADQAVDARTFLPTCPHVACSRGHGPEREYLDGFRRPPGHQDRQSTIQCARSEQISPPPRRHGGSRLHASCIHHHVAGVVSRPPWLSPSIMTARPHRTLCLRVRYASSSLGKLRRTCCSPDMLGKGRTRILRLFQPIAEKNRPMKADCCLSSQSRTSSALRFTLPSLSPEFQTISNLSCCHSSCRCVKFPRDA